MRKSLQS